MSEIKKMLDRLFVYRNENDEMKYQPEDILTIEDVWLLLDYITNLQEEKENQAHTIKTLLEENERLKKTCLDLTSKCGSLKLVKEAAIEYIKSHTNNLMFELRIEEMEYLLNILQGEDKDE